MWMEVLLKNKWAYISIFLASILRQCSAVVSTNLPLSLVMLLLSDLLRSLLTIPELSFKNIEQVIWTSCKTHYCLDAASDFTKRLTILLSPSVYSKYFQSHSFALVTQVLITFLYLASSSVLLPLHCQEWSANSSVSVLSITEYLLSSLLTTIWHYCDRFLLRNVQEWDSGEHRQIWSGWTDLGLFPERFKEM